MSNAAFINALKPGSLCDARDCYERYHAARILTVERTGAAVPAGQIQNGTAHVHFLGWEPMFDEVVPLCSIGFAPIFSKRSITTLNPEARKAAEAAYKEEKEQQVAEALRLGEEQKRLAEQQQMEVEDELLVIGDGNDPDLVFEDDIQDTDDQIEPEEYELDSILGHRWSQENNRIEYLARWKDYPISAATFEPASCFNGTTIAEYWRADKGKRESLRQKARVVVDRSRRMRELLRQSSLREAEAKRRHQVALKQAADRADQITRMRCRITEVLQQMRKAASVE